MSCIQVEEAHRLRDRQMLDAVLLAAVVQRERGVSHLEHADLEVQYLADAERLAKIAMYADRRRAHAPLGDHLGVRMAQAMGEPVLQRRVRHVEKFREVDDARRVAVREAHLLIMREYFAHSIAPS